MGDAAADVAVIGISCRLPGVPTVNDFWRLLADGRSTVGRFPAHRAAAAAGAADPDGATVTAGSFFDSVDGFDAAFFGTGAAEAAAMDPVQRLGLELAWEAVEDARMPAATLAGREIDVVVGAASSGYDILRRLSGSDRDDHYAALGSSGALIANRVSALFDVRGMSFCADSGQSSSLVALTLACDRIRSGATGMAIAGGVSLIADPQAGLALANLGALSPDGRCFTFDDRASGFVRGEGGGFAVLKRLDLALADGDHVYAVVRGWSTGNGGASSRMPDPSPGAQAATVLAALRRADVPFDTVDYVEAHGTGTRLGDPAELTGLREVFRRTGRSRRLVIGSVKTNIGHLEPAAGIAGFLKAVLCLDRAQLVASLNFRAPNPAVPDFARDFDVPVAGRPWPAAPDRPRRAGVSAFGMGGTNAHVILEEAPRRRPAQRAEPAEAVPGMLPWALSARSEPALREQAARLRDLVAADASLTTADVGYSLVSTRSLFEHRAVVLSGTRDEALAALDAVATGRNSPRAIRGVAGGPAAPVVFVFPGQGSQWAGMGRQLYEESAAFARSIDECAEALAPWVDWSLVDVLTGAPHAASLDRSDVVQPALFAMQVSLARMWRSFGVAPDAVVGTSQGEMAAACVSGALSLSDAARIVALRGRALRDLDDAGSGMLAVSAPGHWVRGRLERCAGRLCVAAVNGPVSTVIAGDDEALRQFATSAAGDGVRARRVTINYASHSPQVEPLRDRLLTELAGTTPAPSTVPMHSTVTGAVVEPQALDSSYWYDNLRSVVRFGEVTERLLGERGAVFVEVSPHPMLQLAIEESADALTVPALVTGTLRRNDGGTGRFLTSLAQLHVRGVPVAWEAVFAAHRPRRIGLPTYAFQRQRYWLSAPQDTGSPAGAATVPVSRLPEPAVIELVCAEAGAVLSEHGAEADVTARSADTFRDLGFDSSMVVRLRNRLTAAVGVRLPATVAFSYPTPQALGRHLATLLAPQEPTAPGTEDTGGAEGAEDRSDHELYELIDRGYA